jgi:muramoyltetrapeptide carboxypeptidase
MIIKGLKQNEIVDIISPGTASSTSEIKKIKNFVKKIGLQPRIFLEEKLTLKKPTSHEFPSFDAEIRFQQLAEVLTNSQSKIIWCTRGGYGTGDLLPFLKKLKKPQTAKIFIGFSDISSLNKFLIEEWNWQVVTAPMLIQLALNKVSKKSEKNILDLIFGKKSELNYSLITPHPSLSRKGRGNIESVVTGGCISVLAGHFGTKNQLDWDKKILFLEDEGEDGERLDRYFRQLVEIMVEQKKYPRAILLGNFLETNPHGTPKAKNINLAIERFAQKLQENKLKIPLFLEKSKCLGHSKNMMPLILGASAKITAEGFLIQKF